MNFFYFIVKKCIFFYMDKKTLIKEIRVSYKIN